MKTVNIHKLSGEFGENKDIAKKIRNSYVLPALEQNKSLELDFTGVTGVTQSFIHAMIAEAIRRHPDTFYEKIIFKNCSKLVQTIISIVSEYMQESG